VTVQGTDDEATRAPAGVPRGRLGLPALRLRLTPPPGSAGRDPVIWAIAALVLCCYFVISLFRLLQLTPGSYDLGIYVEYVKQLSQLHAPIGDVLGPGFNLLGNHFQIAVGVIAPFFRIFPTAGTLLFFQALATAVSIFPVVTAANVFTGKSTARLIGFAYGLSWGLQQMIDFDFHEIALAVPLIAFSVSALARRRPAAAIAWAVPLVFVKEDQGFTVAAIGVLLGATMAFRPAIPTLKWGNGRLALWGGLSLVAWGLFWSAFAIIVIIPHFNPLHTYYFWGDGGAVGGGHFSAGGLIKQAGSGWPTKGQTLVLLLLPTAFAALGSPIALIAIPSLLLRFISTNTAFWGTVFHYNATVMPILFIAAAEAIGRWRRTSALTWPLTGADRALLTRPDGPASPLGPPWARLPAGARQVREAAAAARRLLRAAQGGLARHGGAMMAAIAVALAFQFPLSYLWHAATYRLDAHVDADNAAMAAVPDGATVQTTLDLLAPLAARADTFWIGTAGNPATKYIVFDGPDSGYSPAVTNVPQFIAHLYPHDGYVQVFDRDGVYVFRRAS
jgi:uncharacterized membrane protein